MNRIERSVLFPILKLLRETHENAWWELKWQIWDGGFRPYYQMQGEFEVPVARGLERLDLEHKALLRSQWKAQHPNEVLSDQSVNAHYQYVLIEELVKRAWQAAYRTSNW